MIDGPGAGLVTISGNDAVGVFQVDSGEVATLSGLTISGGRYVGVASMRGGILAQEFSTLTVSGSTISAIQPSAPAAGSPAAAPEPGELHRLAGHGQRR